MTSFHPSVAYGILIFMMWNKLGPLVDEEGVTHWSGSIAPSLSSKSHEDSIHSDHQASTGCVYGCWLAENMGRTASLEVSGAIDKVEKQQEFQSWGGASWCLSLLGQQFEIGINSWEGDWASNTGYHCSCEKAPFLGASHHQQSRLSFQAQTNSLGWSYHTEMKSRWK